MKVLIFLFCKFLELYKACNDLDFKGKFTNTKHNVIIHESKSSHYQITTDIIVIHHIITSLQGITILVNTPIYIIILVERTQIFIEST